MNEMNGIDPVLPISRRRPLAGRRTSANIPGRVIRAGVRSRFSAFSVPKRALFSTAFDFGTEIDLGTYTRNRPSW